jgi:hypothetical protein
LSLRLERGFGGLAGAALAAVLAATLAAAVLALFPAAAGAQTQNEGATSVVVRPGDSLWTISEERLGPNASSRRVMKGTERIHALNRARIGADPDLLLVGQELSVPRAMSGQPTRATTPAREAAEASGSDPRDRAARGPAGKEAPGKASGQGVIPRSEMSLEEAAEMLGSDAERKEALPDQRAVAPVPAARMVASEDARPPSVASFLRTVRIELASAASALTEPFFGDAPDARTEGRRLLGLGLIVLSLLIPVVVALTAAYGRGASRREARKREPSPQGPHGGPHPGLDPSANHLDRLDLLAVARAKRERVRRKRTLDVRRRRRLAHLQTPDRSRHRRLRRR